MSQIEANVGEALLAEYAAAVLAKDAARLAALYAPDVRVFETWETWSFEGREAWSRNLHDWLGSLGEEQVRVRFDDVRAEQRGEMGWLSAIGIYSAVDATGQILRSMQNRFSWVLAKGEGGWAIVHEHTSAPIAFADQKALLKRA